MNPYRRRSTRSLWDELTFLRDNRDMAIDLYVGCVSRGDREIQHPDEIRRMILAVIRKRSFNLARV